MPSSQVSLTCALYYTILVSCGFLRAASVSSCSRPVVSGDISYKWPTQNPMLVAPVNLNYAYEIYDQPLVCENTGKALSIPVPEDFPGAFSVSENASAATATGTFEEETYVLRSMEIRKPGKNYEGSSQVLGHSLELSLVHQQVGGEGYWANVIIPFEPSGESAYDMLAPLVAGATMPATEGDREPVLLSSAQVLDLQRGFLDSTFLNFWTTLPTDCADTAVPARQFMKTAAMNMGEGTFAALMDALDDIPDYPPIQSPDDTWITNSCPPDGGACTGVEVQDLQQQYDDAQLLQSQATTELRSRKDLMDQAYWDLGNDTEGSLEHATAARSDLSTAEQEMLSVEAYTNELEGWLDASTSNAWNSDAPEGPEIEDYTIGALTMLELSGQPHPVQLAQGSKANQRQDCSAYRQSPVDIDTQRVMDPRGISMVLAQPLRFNSYHANPRAGALVHVYSTGDYVRVQAKHPGALGTVAVLGEQKQISYVDLRVPSEHAVDGRGGAAEMQFIHLPPSGQQHALAIGVSIRFDTSKDADNAWLTAVVQGLHMEEEATAIGALADLHDVFAQGKTSRYFRYDGTTTTMPCRGVSWFVVEELGHIGEAQLEQLRLATMPRESPRFTPSLVARGTQKLFAPRADGRSMPTQARKPAAGRAAASKFQAETSRPHAMPEPSPALRAHRARAPGQQQRLRV